MCLKGDKCQEHSIITKEGLNKSNSPFTMNKSIFIVLVFFAFTLTAKAAPRIEESSAKQLIAGKFTLPH